MTHDGKEWPCQAPPCTVIVVLLSFSKGTCYLPMFTKNKLPVTVTVTVTATFTVTVTATFQCGKDNEKTPK